MVAIKKSRLVTECRISSDMKLNAKLKNLDFCDVVFVCAYGRREYRAHRIAFAHASEKF